MTNITLLDGSIGQEIVKRSGERPTPLWSTAAMIDHPELTGAVHSDYFRAGATIATTNTYAVWPDRLEPAGIPEQHLNLLDTAATQATAARDAHGSGRIAASLGPLGASYRPDITFPLKEAAATFRTNAKYMLAHVDILLIETVSSFDAAEAALMGCAGLGKPVWLALSVDDDDGTKLRSGEPLTALAELFERHMPDAVLLNCSRPEAISQGLPLLANLGLPFGAYANGFTHISSDFLETAPTVEALSERHDLGPKDYAKFVMNWVGNGATIVGGCCEVGPDHIKELAQQLTAAGHTIV